MHIRMLRKLKIRNYTGFVIPAMFLFLLAGCAFIGKVKPAPVVQEPSATNGSSVTQLDNGREGFTITEVPKMDEASRKDFDRAVTLLKDQEYGEAIDLLEKIIEKSPGVTAPYIDIAIAYQRIDKPEQAEKYLKTALRLFPDHPVVCNEYGLLYRKTGRFAEARTIYEKAISRFPNYYPVHRNLGILCDLYLNDLTCAMEHYEIYSEAMPEDNQVKSWIADLRIRLGSN
ncbi:MAG: tetratricopeptide repeat protein [Desulfobacterales bacterium]